MFPVNEGNQDQRLDALLRAYRDACVAPEPGPNFMPQLWQRIESRQRFSFSFGRVARGFVTAALAVTVLMTIFLATPRSASTFSNGNYVDVLAASHNNDNSDLYEFVGYDVGASQGEL